MARRRVFAAAVLVMGLALAIPPTTAAAAAPPLTIYPLGDSITYGYTPQADTPGGYRSALDTILTQNSISHLFLGTLSNNPSATLNANKQPRHEGHKGYRIDQDATGLDGMPGGNSDNGGYWLTGTATRPPINPDVVLIHLGTNDILQKFDPGTTFADGNPYNDPAEQEQFVDDMTERLDSLIGKLFAMRPSVRIVVASPVPLAQGKDSDRVPADFAVAVRALVAQRRAASHAVVFADVFGSFMTSGADGDVLTPGLISNDGIHPTPGGYSRIAQTLGDAITELLNH